MDVETLLLLRQLLGSVQLSGDAPDFDEWAAKISKARRQLDEAIKAAGPKGD